MSAGDSRPCSLTLSMMLVFLVLTALLLTGTDAFLFTDVPCPNPAENCLQEMFNMVMERQGCLGCQTGCQSGYIMTANPRYYLKTDNPTGQYLYRNIPIANNVNVSEAQWLCHQGDSCHSGYFTSTMADMTSCSWCGEGCAKCTSFNNCQRCFNGFTLNPHSLPGHPNVVTCTHTDVLCPNPPSHCLHETYVAAGIGCAGCQLCEDGYVVNFNPNYLNRSRGMQGTYTYMGLTIRQDVDVYEARFLCVEGRTCREGWFGTEVDGTLFCAKCSEGCAQCSSLPSCEVCSSGYRLVEGSSPSSTKCVFDSSAASTTTTTATTTTTITVQPTTRSTTTMSSETPGLTTTAAGLSTETPKVTTAAGVGTPETTVVSGATGVVGTTVTTQSTGAAETTEETGRTTFAEVTTASSSTETKGPVPCPNPAENCLQEMFNMVMERTGCLGCQTGCQPGHIMTANPRYYLDTDNPTGQYLYRNIPIANNVNVSEPQWLCIEGDTCHSGYFTSAIADMTTCSWCGEGCAQCTSFNNCQRCFTGFTLNPHSLPGQPNVATCAHTDVMCPAPPTHCLHETYVAAGIGCAGCQLCEHGYVVTFNPHYLNSTLDPHGTYTYNGIDIRQDVDVYWAVSPTPTNWRWMGSASGVADRFEPRYICEEGRTCKQGWYGTLVDGVLYCAECNKGCEQCTRRTSCDVCADGYHLQNQSDTQSRCVLDKPTTIELLLSTTEPPTTTELPQTLLN